MRPDYPLWLTEQKYAESAQKTRVSSLKKVEECYGDIDEHFSKGTYREVITSLQYSMQDERANRPNPSKINFEGNIRNNLQHYKSAIALYQKFLNDSGFQGRDIQARDLVGNSDIITPEEESIQRFSLERDMQAALRGKITSLDPYLRIIDDGAERAVSSGLIDITCEDNSSLVVVELKAGKADSRAIGQILGYMGDLQEESGKTVRGILIAHDFDQRAKSAARVVPTLTLKRYSIAFNFSNEI